MRYCIFILLAAVWAGNADAASQKNASPAQNAAASAPIKKEPSANKGKTGSYQCHTSHEGYDYWVCVPPSYSDDNPAGMHLFFHGQGGQGGAPHFGSWEGFINEHNLIGINMQYQDGDNGKDTAGKVAAAREAIAQTLADYKIIPGRGVVCSFSGGGLPHAGLFKTMSTVRGPEWPFSHLALYSSNYRASAPNKCCSMSWFISTGQAEWDLADLGGTNTARAVEMLGAAAKGGDADIYFKVMKGKGHSIEAAEVAESLKGFKRSDLVIAPFIYEADYTDGTLLSIARQCNAQQLNSALTACEGVLKGKANDDIKKKAETIKTRILSRAKRILDVVKDITENDPVLCQYYGPKYLQALSGLPEAKEAQPLLQAAQGKANYNKMLGYKQAFADAMRTMFAGGGKIIEGRVALLEDLKKAAEKSQFGMMAAEYLLLEHAPGK